MIIRLIRVLLDRGDTSPDECKECGDPVPVGDTRCDECIGDFEDGGTVIL
jgi:hypothetical protein